MPLVDAATKQFGVEPVPPPETISGDRWIGRRLGNYVVDRALARGGMGAVYVARHPHLGREVAVKFLAEDVSTAPELAARFLAEARVTASLNHPNIVEILDFGEMDGALYYVMELLRGKSLRAVMREQGRLSSAAMNGYVEQICWALDAAHAAGIVHRDLKPANVLVLEGEPLRLKLVDFGVAKLMANGPTQTRAGQVLGTATHMAPEQALGDPRLVTPQSDLYSLGVIAYEMLTGAPVFQHESEVMLMVMHVRDAVRPIREQVPEVPSAVARLVEQCLAKSPGDRPLGARALAEALAAAVADSPSELVLEPAPAPRLPAPAPELPLAEQATRLAAEAAPLGAPAAAVERTMAARAPAIAPSPAPAPAEAKRAPAAPAAEARPAGATRVSPAPAIQPAPARAALDAGKIEVAPARAQVLRGAPPPERPAANAEATLQTLLGRLQRRGDFPAFARAVGEVSQKADANSAFSAGQLGDSILKDFALTARLLKIVNANYARRFGGKVYSVKHAIVILGFDRVRSLALSISLFKASGGKGSERATESAISALVSSEIARTLASSARVSDDEATVCAMFKNLGRHLLLVHMPELFQQIEAIVAEEKVAVALAAKRVLGLTFEELGTAIAKGWQLPPQVVGAMSSGELPDGELVRPEDRLNALAGFANELCDLVTRESPETRERAVRELLAKHKHLVTLDGDALGAILEQVESSIGERYSALLGKALDGSRFLANVAASRRESAAGEASAAAKALALAPELPAAPLAERIQEVRESLERGRSSDAVLTLALRIVADHLRARAPLLLTASPDRQNLMVRFGLREDIDGLRRELKFSLRPPRNRKDLIASAYHAGKDLVVSDCFLKEVSDALPPSYYEVLGSPGMALYACLGKAALPALLLVVAEAGEALPDPARVAELAELRPLIARAAARG